MITTNGSASVSEPERNREAERVHLETIMANFGAKGVCFCVPEALEIGADVPSDTVIDTWLGEPIKAAVLPTSIFLTNKKGFPVLSKAHQRIIFSLFKVRTYFSPLIG